MYEGLDCSLEKKENAFAQQAATRSHKGSQACVTPALLPERPSLVSDEGPIEAKRFSWRMRMKLMPIPRLGRGPH